MESKEIAYKSNEVGNMIVVVVVVVVVASPIEWVDLRKLRTNLFFF